MDYRGCLRLHNNPVLRLLCCMRRRPQLMPGPPSLQRLAHRLTAMKLQHSPGTRARWAGLPVGARGRMGVASCLQAVAAPLPNYALLELCSMYIVERRSTMALQGRSGSGWGVSPLPL